MATVRVRFNEFGWDALTTAAKRLGKTNAELVAASCRRFPPRLAERPPPRFVPRGRGTPREVTIDLDEVRYAAIERQANDLGVDMEAVIRHNVFRLLAEVGAGEDVPGLTGKPAGDNGDV